jgi:hypothetical protein
MDKKKRKNRIKINKKMIKNINDLNIKKLKI